MKKRIIVGITILFLFILSVPLFPRDITIIVLDSDFELPLEGAKVRTRDGQEFICDRNGRAIIPAPDNRQIIIHAVYPGYETRPMIIPISGNTFIVHLRLSGFLMGRELIIEASRPGTSETRTGRSIAVTAAEISQTAEIGIIEDVMSTIKLLPGVGHSGVFSAQPSIRGGHPGDMIAALDGFYINNPYFWGGGYSIFDPRIVQSAQLSHGVFSSRYGHTISGLLEVTTKEPSSTETQFELGLNTSATNISLSVPFSGKGGFLFVGRLTYYDLVIAAAKLLSDLIPELSAVEYISRSPYIRSGTLNAHYKFTDNLNLTATGFWGMDGMGAYYDNSRQTGSLETDTVADFDFVNYQGFFTTTLSWNPKNNMLFRLTAGTGYEDRIIDGEMTNNILNRNFSNEFKSNPDYYDLVRWINIPLIPFINDNYSFDNSGQVKLNDFLYNAQGRIDFDWVLSENFMLSAGIQEMFNWYSAAGDQRISLDRMFSSLSADNQNDIKSSLSMLIPADSPVWNQLRVSVPIQFASDNDNYLFTTSGYLLTEYNYGNKFKAELGLRLDHFFITGDGFALSSDPAINPRLNLEYNVLRGDGFLRKMDISAGTGLFSSVSDNVFSAENRYEIDKIRPNRSWTSILGLRFEFPESLSFNIEGYYKYVFDRMYIPMAVNVGDLDINPQFDGEGMVWGLDVMLHKVQSRFWDGWLAYSYNWAKYRDPQGSGFGFGGSGGNSGDWYFPSFHRYHNLNLVMNIKPISNINIYFRFGLASGSPL
ncbi:MAG: TonB-dependent receptor plug domain-containing protein, partial [Treponema sp.]|nr:TonB-dependent receptor plug domain-containing protein [Treponema sp.]